MSDEAVQVLLRMTDASSTYQYWRWLDDPDHPQYQVLGKDVLTEVEELIVPALVTTREGETPEAAVHRAMVQGPFSHPDKERAWSEHLAQLVFPRPLAQQITDRVAQGQQILLRIIPSPRLAQVPWELLVLPDQKRLLEHVTVRLDVPAVVNSGRGHDPEPWPDARHRDPLILLEPYLRPADREKVITAGKMLGDAGMDTLHLTMDRVALGTILRGEPCPEREKFLLETPGAPSRLFYYGHANSTPEEPGSASIELTDTSGHYSTATPDAHGHRAFTALDLLLGTMEVNYRDPQMIYPHPEQEPGHKIWPMPPRVALIACESGADHRALETFGMVVAMHNAGAEIVTSTRWTLPTDHAFHTAGGIVDCPTTALAICVNNAHETEDPIAAIRYWQLEQLQRWQGSGQLQTTPLVWAALTTHHAPAPRTPTH